MKHKVRRGVACRRGIEVTLVSVWMTSPYYCKANKGQSRALDASQRVKVKVKVKDEDHGRGEAPLPLPLPGNKIGDIREGRSAIC